MGRRRPVSRPHLPFLLLIILIAVLSLAGFKVYQEYHSSILVNSSRLNFLTLTPLAFYSLSPADKTAVKINLPEDLYVEVAYGYGQYKLKAVYDLGELDKRGGKVLTATVADLLGVPVAGYLDSLTLKRNYQTNFNYFDLATIGLNYFNLRPDRIKEVDLDKISVLDDLVLADGTTVKSLDFQKLDYLLNNNFYESRLISEGLKIEVLNAGTISGLGNRAARLLTNIGLTVVNVGNEDFPIGECEVKAPKPSLTATRITQIFGCKLMAKEAGRADISLILRVLHPGE